MANRKISDLAALTTPASGDYLPIVDVSEAAAADKNKRITVEELMRGVPNGTVGAPGIAFESDPDTGIYSPDADQLALATAGTGRLFIDADGKVGLNEPNPGSYSVLGNNLVIKGTSHEGISIISGSSSSGNILFGDSDAAYKGYIKYTHSVDQLQFAANGFIYFRITSTGQLHADSRGGNVAPVYSFTSDTDTGIYSPGADQLALSTAGSERARIDSSGRLLVGTSSARSNIEPFGTGSVTFNLQHEGTSASAGLAITRNSVDAGGSYLILGKTGGTAVSESTVVNSGDNVGVVSFVAADGTKLIPAATINAQVDGTPGANDMPGRLIFSTTADGASSPTERMRIDSSGRVGIGTTSPASTLDVNGDITITDKIIHSEDTNTAIRFPANDTVSIETAGSEAARIDSSGRLLVGTSSARSSFYNTTVSSALQVEGTDGSNATVSIVQNSNNTASGGLTIGKSRGTSVGSNVIGLDGDNLGLVSFQGNDGSDFVEAARIQAQIDGTPGNNDMPGRLVFSTTADGASSLTEQLRITSDRYVRLASGTGGIQFNGDTAAANALDDYEEGVWGSATAPNRRYTKVGSLVHCTMEINLPASGDAFLQTLPFKVRTSTAGFAAIEVGNWFVRKASGTYDPFPVSPQCLLQAQDTSVVLRNSTGSSAARTTVSELRTLFSYPSGGMAIFVSFSYITDT